MHPLVIISKILMIAMLIGVIRLIKWADKPWVMAKKGRYRIHKVHGNMWHCWQYRLEKKCFLGWDPVEDEYRCDSKDEDRYNGWIDKYKMRVF